MVHRVKFIEMYWLGYIKRQYLIQMNLVNLKEADITASPMALTTEPFITGNVDYSYPYSYPYSVEEFVVLTRFDDSVHSSVIDIY